MAGGSARGRIAPSAIKLAAGRAPRYAATEGASGVSRGWRPRRNSQVPALAARFYLWKAPRPGGARRRGKPACAGESLRLDDRGKQPDRSVCPCVLWATERPSYRPTLSRRSARPVADLGYTLYIRSE